MYSNYLFIGACTISGGLIYNSIDNLMIKPNIYYARFNIYNYGMLMGLIMGSGLSYLKYSKNLLLKDN
jgi:hypothetical protein